MNRLKVLVVAPPREIMGGVNAFANILCDYMGQRHDVRRTGVGQDFSGLPMPLRVLRDGWRMVNSIRRFRPDVVQINPSFDKAVIREAFYLSLVRVFHRGVTVVFNHGWGTTMPGQVHESGLLRRMARLLYGSADRIYVLGATRRKALLDWDFGVSQVRATTTMYDPAPLNAARRSRPPVGGDGRIRLLFLSRQVPGKGAGELIEVFSRLVTRHHQLDLVCAGDGADRPRLEALSASLGLSGRVRFPGFVLGELKARELLDADVFVLPTQLNEGFPVSLLEAMGAGMPIVASGVGGVVDLFGKGAQGQMMSSKPGLDEIERSIEKWIIDPDRIRRAGEANRILAQQQFSAGAWCDAMEQDFLQLVAARASLPGAASSRS